MAKTRLILIGSAIILVIVIFTLPKVVVDNEQGQVEDTENPTQQHDSQSMPIDSHNQQLSAGELEVVKQLKEKLKGSDNVGKSINFADSLAKLYLKSNKYDSAAKYIEIIALNSPTEQNMVKAGNAWYDAYGFAMDKAKKAAMGAKAREYYQKILEVTPQNLEVKNKLAMTYVSTSNPMQGVLMLREILEVDAKNEQAMFNLGVLSMQSRQYDKAIERFAALKENYPDNIQAQFFLGVCYLEAGNKTKAKEQFELVKSMDNDPAVQATADSYLKDIE